MSKAHKIAILWFRNDLRLSDNYSLNKAISLAEYILPIFVFDKRNQSNVFQSKVSKIPRAGIKRIEFLLESVKDLQHSLQERGSDLIIRFGFPEIEILKLVKETNASLLIAHKETTLEEINVEKKLSSALCESNITVEFIWDNTMYHIDDIPYTISEIPDIYTEFRKTVEKQSSVRKTIPIPKNIPFPLDYSISKDNDNISSLSDLGFTNDEIENNEKEKQFNIKKGNIILKGGESNAFKRVNDYFFNNKCLQNYKDTRNGMMGLNYSSKFSAWLACGCISPRSIYENVKKYESDIVKNKSTYWMLFELLWRDYFKLWVYKKGNSVFFLRGPKNRCDIKWNSNNTYINSWKDGNTGIPLIDACMRELKITGFMSNRGRQNVCSFLSKDMGVDWRYGAEWFENILVDYDCSSNWGNWVYGSGVGNDPRDDRYFNILKQSVVYDSDGDFIKHWCPELSSFPKSLIHTPWKATKIEQNKYNCTIGKDYPKPIITLKSGMNPWKSKKQTQRRRKQ